MRTWSGLAVILAMFLFVAAPSNALVIFEDFNGSVSSYGISNGITYAATPNGQGAVFSRDNESRVQYPFAMGFPREGTVEFLIKVSAGYQYSEGALSTIPSWYDFNSGSDQETSPGWAPIFQTGSLDIWWPGAMNLWVEKTGRVWLETATGWAPAQSHNLEASTSSFRYDEWHSVGFSFGSQGQYIMVDGQIVAYNTSYTELMEACGTLISPSNSPTIGETQSVLWPENYYEYGFDGIVDTLRISDQQQDWNVALGNNPVPEPSSMFLFGSGLLGLVGARRRFKK